MALSSDDHSNRSTVGSSWDKCVQFELPSSRNFIRNHPSSYIANLHSDTTKIGPTWTKVTTTPWEGRAKLCGGYGRRLCGTSISNDAPLTFVNPEVVPIPANRMDDAAAFVIGTRVPSKQESFAVSQILPGGQGIKEATIMKQQGSGPTSPYRTFPVGKQTLIDNVPADSDSNRSPLKWDSTPRDPSFSPNKRPNMIIVSARNQGTGRNVLQPTSGRQPQLSGRLG
jgi:hypothetical protein